MQQKDENVIRSRGWDLWKKLQYNEIIILFQSKIVLFSSLDKIIACTLTQRFCVSSPAMNFRRGEKRRLPSWRSVCSILWSVDLCWKMRYHPTGTTENFFDELVLAMHPGHSNLDCELIFQFALHGLKNDLSISVSRGSSRGHSLGQKGESSHRSLDRSDHGKKKGA